MELAFADRKTAAIDHDGQCDCSSCTTDAHSLTRRARLRCRACLPLAPLLLHGVSTHDHLRICCLSLAIVCRIALSWQAAWCSTSTCAAPPVTECGTCPHVYKNGVSFAGAAARSGSPTACSCVGLEFASRLRVGLASLQRRLEERPQPDQPSRRVQVRRTCHCECRLLLSSYRTHEAVDRRILLVGITVRRKCDFGRCIAS
jgi:hypothetical protein